MNKALIETAAILLTFIMNEWVEIMVMVQSLVCVGLARDFPEGRWTVVG